MVGILVVKTEMEYQYYSYRIVKGDTYWLFLRMPSSLTRERAKAILETIGTYGEYYRDPVENTNIMLLGFKADISCLLCTPNHGFVIVYRNKEEAYRGHRFIGEPHISYIYNIGLNRLSAIMEVLNSYLEILFNAYFSHEPCKPINRFTIEEDEEDRIKPLRVVLPKDNILRLVYLALFYKMAGLDQFSELMLKYAEALDENSSTCIDIPFSHERFDIEYKIAWTLYYITGSIAVVRDVLEEIAWAYCDGVVSETSSILKLIRIRSPPLDKDFLDRIYRVKFSHAIRLRDTLSGMLGGKGDVKAS